MLRLGAPGRAAALLCALTATGAFACSRAPQAGSAEALVERIRLGLERKDPGAIMSVVDRSYADELGGPGRLEDDIRQFLTVYGALRLEIHGLERSGDQLRARSTVRGRGLSFSGPLNWTVASGAMGPLLRSGLLTDLRGVVDTLRQRRLAVERGSVDRLDLVLSMEYRAAEGTRAQVLDRARESFSAARDTAMIVDELEIEIAKDRAKVSQAVLLISHVRDRVVEHRDRERIVLRKEGTRWRIFEGLG